MSRRDNGLPATSYVRLRDVESHLAEGLLDRLREEDVAAYVAPAPGKRGPYGDTVLPDMPSDSVFVDAGRLGQARSVSEHYLREVADELAWASIVADYDTPATDDAPRWPASEDVDDPDAADDPRAGDDPGATEGRGGSRMVRPAESPSMGFGELRDALATGPASSYGDNDRREDPAPVGDAEHFEPPPPPPLPVPDTVGRFAWAAVLGGPLFLVVTALLRLDVAGWPGFLALSAFVGGFVTLVARMKDRPDTDLDGDDGAVV